MRQFDARLIFHELMCATMACERDGSGMRLMRFIPGDKIRSTTMLPKAHLS